MVSRRSVIRVGRRVRCVVGERIMPVKGVRTAIIYQEAPASHATSPAPNAPETTTTPAPNATPATTSNLLPMTPPAKTAARRPTTKTRPSYAQNATLRVKTALPSPLTPAPPASMAITSIC
jgi:hypothetical protein